MRAFLDAFEVVRGRDTCRGRCRNMTSNQKRRDLVGEPAPNNVRVRYLTMIDDFHAKLDRAFDDLLSTARSRGQAGVRESMVVRKSEPPDRTVR